jgi:hypothetical protein
MDIEENGADKENIPLAMLVMDDEPSTNRKLNCLEEISCWHESVNNLPNNVQIDLAYLRELKLRESVPVTWCVQNHDVHFLELFVPAFFN